MSITINGVPREAEEGMPVVGRIIPPSPTPKMSTSKYLWCYHICQRLKVANRVKVANQLTLRCVDYPGFSRWTWWCNHNGFLMQKREAEEGTQSDTPWGTLSLLLLALKMEVGQELRNVGNRSQKRQVNPFHPRASRIEFSPANALISAQGDSF